MLPAAGCVTASAKAVATAASTALPPMAITEAPASQAGADVHTTRPSFDGTPRSCRAATPPLLLTETASKEKRRRWFFIGISE
jgi:hypothetical protein